MTNGPNRVDGVETLPSHIADHSFVKLNFHSDILKSKPQFRETRNFNNINADVLMEEINNNAKLQGLFALKCPNKIFNILIEEINNIINKIAPAKLIQIKRKDHPYMNNDLKELKKELDDQLNNAIVTKELEEWRLYKTLRNSFFKIVENAKKI